MPLRSSNAAAGARRRSAPLFHGRYRCRRARDADERARRRRRGTTLLEPGVVVVEGLRDAWESVKLCAAAL